MAPAETARVEQQTRDIILCLFEEDGGSSEDRLFQHSSGYETDGPEDFDPVLIADKLRSVADSLNDDVTFRACLNDLKKAAAQGAAEKAFSDGVEALCQAQVSQRAEVAPEMQLIRASVALGLYINKSSPDLKNTVQSAMMTFLNSRVGSWVAQQGGWNKVTCN